MKYWKTSPWRLTAIISIERKDNDLPVNHGRGSPSALRRASPGFQLTHSTGIKVGTPNTIRVHTFNVGTGLPSLARTLLECPIFEVFFGGARGGGKTDGMLGEWVRHADRLELAWSRA
jgi:hypothetical protein